MTKANEASEAANDLLRRAKEFRQREWYGSDGEQIDELLAGFAASLEPATAARETELLPNWVLPMIRELARELYDRFVMGGWEPQDAYPQMTEIIYRHWQAARSSVEPAAQTQPWMLEVARKIRIRIHNVDPENEANKKWLESVIIGDVEIIRAIYERSGH